MTPRSLTHQKVQFGSDTAARVHFFVTSQPQSASFRHVAHRKTHSACKQSRRVRLSVECAFPHLGKRGATSRKDAVCNHHLTEKRSLGSLVVADCAFPSRCPPKDALCMRTVAQNASFRHVGRRVSSCGSHVKGVVCGKRAFAAMLARDAECVRLIQLEDMNERHCFPRVPCT